MNANRESGMELEQAIDEAIAVCMEEGILKEFFRMYKNAGKAAIPSVEETPQG